MTILPEKLLGLAVRTFLLQSAIAEDWIVNGHTRKIIVNRVLGVDESVCYVGHVVASVAFASYIHLAVLYLKRVDELPVESGKLLTEFNLVGDVWNSLAKANTNRLFDPTKSVRIPGIECLGAGAPQEERSHTITCW